MRLLVTLASALLAGGFATPAFAGGTIDIQTTSFDNFMVVDVIVADNGGPLTCPGPFVLRRRLYTDCSSSVLIGTIVRQPGTTTTHRFFDGPLQPSHAYVYEVDPCWGFTWARDCNSSGFPIKACATTTPLPALLGQGTIEPGDPGFAPCPGGCDGESIISFPGELLPYVGSGTALLVYGGLSWSCSGCCWGWVITLAQAQPASCTISVDQRTWGSTKSLFR